MNFSKYAGKPFSWWLQTPIYAYRIARIQIRHRLGYHAQNGEDKELKKLFPQRGGFCVEVGAHDGVNGSNTFYFTRKRGWNALLIEADPRVAQTCAANRPEARTIAVAAVAPELVGKAQFQVIEHETQMSSLAFDEAGIGQFAKHGVEFAPTTITVDARTLDSMLNEIDAPKIEFITIDVEGHELGVLQGFDLARWAPRCIVLERITREPHPEIVTILEGAGYRRAFHLPRDVDADCNDFWLPVESK